MLRWSLALLLLSPCSIRADQIIWLGETYSFVASPYPTDPQNGYQIALGYGTESNTIGDDLWVSEPGVYDLSTDIDLPGFLGYAANGQPDAILLTITDPYGEQSVPWYPEPGIEDSLFARYEWIDLFPLNVTGVQLNLLDLYSLSPAGTSGVVVRWEFLGIPEPSTALVILATLVTLARRHQPVSK